QGAFGGRGPIDRAPGDFDMRSILRELARFYDYLLLVTAPTTPAAVIERVAENCARAILLISRDALGREGETLAMPFSIFIAHVPEQPTIGTQDRDSQRLG